ncbi:MAG: glycoside hydrolase family 2 TIM barrel-domain containing protein, partial [Bacteroidota bacterium]
MKKLLKSAIAAACLVMAFSCNNSEKRTTASAEDMAKTEAAKVEMKKEGDAFQLYVNGEPFYIDGAGLEFGDIPALAAHGANSFRTWRTDNGRRSGKEVLDEAQKYGLYVTMGIEIARERHGFNYDDPAEVAEQFERVKAEVMELKDHPALIIWAVGNELNLNATNPKVWDAVNDISKMIHEIDPNHLTTTTLAGIGQELVDDIKMRATDLDLLSIQMYGDIVNLPRYIEETGWDGPYMVTEWGATGHWEVGT